MKPSLVRRIFEQHGTRTKPETTGQLLFLPDDAADYMLVPNFWAEAPGWYFAVDRLLKALHAAEMALIIRQSSEANEMPSDDDVEREEQALRAYAVERGVAAHRESRRSRHFPAAVFESYTNGVPFDQEQVEAAVSVMRSVAIDTAPQGSLLVDRLNRDQSREILLYTFDPDVVDHLSHHAALRGMMTLDPILDRIATGEGTSEPVAPPAESSEAAQGNTDAPAESSEAAQENEGDAS